MPFQFDDQQKEIISKYDFKVRERGDRFEVVDPKLPRRHQKYEGSDLTELLFRAIGMREQFEAGKEPETNVVHRSFKPAKPIKQGKIYHIKVLVLDNPEITNDEIVEKLKEKGLATSLSVVSQVKADFLSTVRLLEELGVLKGRTDGEDKC